MRITSLKKFRNQEILKTCALAFKQENSKSKKDYFLFPISLASILAHYITSGEPWTVANKVFQIFFG